MDWPKNEVYNYQTMNQKDGIVNKIRAKLFFTDLHLLGRYLHNGYYFIRHLLNRVWNVLDRGLEGITGEEFNQSALTHCYSLIANSCIKPDACARHVAMWARPSKETIAKLWDQYRIHLANKSNRVSIPAEQQVSYAFNTKFTLVERVRPREPLIPTSPHIADAKVTDHSSDMDVTGTETHTKTPATPLRSPSSSSTPQYGAPISIRRQGAHSENEFNRGT